ncbi:MAG: hypothetical protein O2816_16815 [Planctomycetota bacterium]|nr:hypothetical protein [Planctomycetota bacterium]
MDPPTALAGVQTGCAADAADREWCTFGAAHALPPLKHPETTGVLLVL